MAVRRRHSAVNSSAPARMRAPGTRLVEGGPEERHVTWLELFFDLVFVVAVAELAHLLHHELTWGGLARFMVLFVPFWWQWLDFSYYADQYEAGRSLDLTLLGVAFGIMALALSLPADTPESSTRFTLILIALRAVIIVLYLRAWRHVSEARELAGRFATSFSVALAVWVASLWFPLPERYWLWVVAQSIEILNGPVTYLTIKHVPRQQSHMDERFGLFVLIVLGESVVAVATGLRGSHWDAGAVLASACGFVAACCCWWLYFSHADPAVIHKALRSDRHALWMSYVYGYSHFFVFAGITAAGVGSEAVLEALTHHEPPGFGGRVMYLGVAAFLFAASLVHGTAPQSLNRSILAGRLAAGSAFLVLALLGVPSSALGLMVLLAAGFLALILYERSRWGPASPPPHPPEG